MLCTLRGGVGDVDSACASPPGIQPPPTPMSSGRFDDLQLTPSTTTLGHISKNVLASALAALRLVCQA